MSGQGPGSYSPVTSVTPVTNPERASLGTMIGWHAHHPATETTGPAR